MSHVSEEIQLKVLVPYANNSMEEFLTGLFLPWKFRRTFFAPRSPVYAVRVLVWGVPPEGDAAGVVRLHQEVAGGAGDWINTIVVQKHSI